MTVKLLPLLLVCLTLGCLVGASGEEDARRESPVPGSSGAASAGRASSASVLVATVTPAAHEASSQLEELAPPTSVATSTSMPADTLVETPTEEPIAEVQVAIATETPAELLHTETPTPLATEAATATSEDTPTATASPTPTASPSPTAAPSSTATATATATNTPSGNGGATGFRGTLLAGHNDARGEAGVGPLDLNGTLNQIAQERAESMASQDRMTHHNADGSTVFEMMSDSGYGYTDGAENIAYNAGYSDSESVEAVMDQWIESPSHYENITKAHLTKVGFGMATSASGKVYYSAVFSD